jgi:hypothetical protein
MLGVCGYFGVLWEQNRTETKNREMWQGLICGDWNFMFMLSIDPKEWDLSNIDNCASSEVSNYFSDFLFFFVLIVW